MPVLVAYNLPFRDCAQYSAGGAADTAAYNAWIDGFAAGIGDRAATVILEPDGLGIIPHYITLDGHAEWCQPAEVPAATAATDRFAQLNHAVDAIGALAAASVYLDGTSASWLNVGEISDRLIKGGVQDADGFFLNASNYQFTGELDSLTAPGSHSASPTSRRSTRATSARAATSTGREVLPTTGAATGRPASAARCRSTASGARMPPTRR